MNPTAVACLAVIAGYLIGAIPFAYVFVRAAKGIDIRTVGSGNVGATNASRVLGLRGFLLVFSCDMLKGFLPTKLLPILVAWRTGETVANLPVYVALATILGHNFPIYLGFKGGKGVSTSLGAAFGLDWAASLAAVVAFGLSLRICKYVSLSSLIGASVFALVHFLVIALVLHASAWDRDHFAVSLLTVGLLVMLLVRHRKNLGRIRNGTEPKITRRKRASGRASIVLLLVVAAGGLVAIATRTLFRRGTVDCGTFTLVELERKRTGHQRAAAPVFAGGGKLLAVLCPRYNRLLIFQVDPSEALQLAQDVTLDGQPTALAATTDRLWVLQRPAGDDRHVRPGYLQAYSFGGQRLGSPIVTGFYPTEMALADQGKTALVLTSGRTEGGPHHGPPALEVVDLQGSRGVGSVTFDHAGESPARLTIADSGNAAAVALRGSNEVAAIDLTDRQRPALVGRAAQSAKTFPYLSVSGGDWIVMPVASDRECVVIPPDGSGPVIDPLTALLVAVSPEGSEVEVRGLASLSPLGRLPLRGAGNFGVIHPSGIAHSADRGLLAITSRSGSVHLVAIRSKAGGSSGDAAAGIPTR